MKFKNSPFKEIAGSLMGELGKLYDLQDDSVKEVNTKQIFSS